MIITRITKTQSNLIKSLYHEIYQEYKSKNLLSKLWDGFKEPQKPYKIVSSKKINLFDIKISYFDISAVIESRDLIEEWIRHVLRYTPEMRIVIDQKDWLIKGFVIYSIIFFNKCEQQEIMIYSSIGKYV